MYHKCPQVFAVIKVLLVDTTGEQRGKPSQGKGALACQSACVQPASEPLDIAVLACRVPHAVRFSRSQRQGKKLFKTTIVPDSESPLLVNNTGHPGEFETKSGAARGWAERTGGRVV